MAEWRAPWPRPGRGLAEVPAEVVVANHVMGL